jgi:uncharacterized protein YjdB
MSMTTLMPATHLRRAAALGALLAGVAACENAFFAPEAKLPTSVAVAYSLTPQAVEATRAVGGPGAAFDQVNTLRVSIRGSGGAEMDTTLAFTARPEVRIPLSLQLMQSEEDAQLSITMLRGSDAIFTGSGRVTLRSGQTSQASLSLNAVAAGLRLSRDRIDFSAIGDTIPVSAAVVFATGDDIPGRTINWSSTNESVALVTSAGLVIARSEGRADIRAVSGDRSVTLAATVQATVAQVRMAPGSDSVAVGASRQATAIPVDRRGNALSRTVAWTSSDSTIAQVSSTGLITGRRAGQVTITAIAGGTRGSMQMRVVQTVASVGVSPASAEVQIGKTVRFSAVPRDAAGNTVAGKTITWASSNRAVATVNADGTVTGVAQGTASITATVDGKVGQATLEVTPVPTAGEDVVVFNDVNVFDGWGIGQPGNQQLIRNLVGFTGGGRAAGKTVWFDFGHAARCDNCTDFSRMRSIITDAGYRLEDRRTAQGQLTSIPADVKVIFFWTPWAEFTVMEINTLKQFAAEGGRIIFVGEREPFYEQTGIAVENKFLKDMGAGMQNVGGDEACSFDSAQIDVPATSFRPHQITTGLTSVRFGCSSVMVPVDGDYPLIYNAANNKVLVGVAKINTIPLGASSSIARTMKSQIRPTDPSVGTVLGRPAGH